MLINRFIKHRRQNEAVPPEGTKPNGTPQPTSQTPPPAIDYKAEFEKMKTEFEALKAKQNQPTNQTPPPSDDLAERARLLREKDKETARQTGELSEAIKFNLSSQTWLSDNASLLPKSVEGILAEANKETYGNDIEKANAIKLGVVQEFFAVQENLDLLTDAQKNLVDDFKKLTKTDRQARVKELYQNIFEPTLLQLARIKKAHQVQKGYGNQSSAEQAYKEKLIKQSEKHYLGVK